MTSIIKPCFIFAKSSFKSNHKEYPKRVTKKQLYNAIQHAKYASQRSPNIIDNIVLWNRVDDLTIQYYDQNDVSKGFLEELFNFLQQKREAHLL